MSWKVKVIDQTPNKSVSLDWENFLENAILPTHYTTSAFFIDPFVRGKRKLCIAAIDSNNQVSAVLTGVQNGRTFVSGLPCRPQIAFRRGSDQRQAINTIYKGITENLSDDGVKLIEICSWTALPELIDLGFRPMSADGRNEVVMIDLSKSLDQIFKAFSQTRRNEIRRAEKEGLIEVKELETPDELLGLYNIHLDWNERKGNAPDSFEDFLTATKQKDHRRTFIAKYAGQVIAGSFFRFCSGGVIEYAGNNSLTEFQRFRPNDLLCWQAIRWAHEQNFSHFSMGGSHLFLRRFGGEIVSTYRYSLDQSFLRYHHIRERSIGFAKKIYLTCPNSVRSKCKSLITGR